MAYTYRRTFARALYEPVRACLENAIRLDPSYADACALLEWVHLDAARFGYVAQAEAASEMDRVLTPARAFTMVKAMQADGLEWGEGYRPLARRALAEIIEGRLGEAVDRRLGRSVRRMRRTAAMATTSAVC